MEHGSEDGEWRLHQFDDEEGSNDEPSIHEDTTLAGNGRTASPTTLVKKHASPPAKPAGVQTDTIGQSIDDLLDRDASIQVGDDDQGHDDHPSRAASDADRRHIWHPTWDQERRGESDEQKMDQSRGGRDDDDESRIRQTIRDGHPTGVRLDVGAGVTSIARREIERVRRSITVTPNSLEESSYGSRFRSIFRQEVDRATLRRFG